MAKPSSYVNSSRPVTHPQHKSFCYGITNVEWLNLKALYFFIFGALGALIPYVILFYTTRGLTATQIGIIELVFTLIGSVSRPLFGSIADKTARHRIVLGICLLVFTVLFFTLSFIRPSSTAVRYPLYLNCNTSTHEFELDACHASEAILANVSLIQPEFVLHHDEVGFQPNCSSIGRSCQVVCGKFKSFRSQEGFGIKEMPFSNLGMHISSKHSSSATGQCSTFPLTIAASHNHVVLACNNTLPMPCEIDCGCSMNKTDIDPNNYNPEIEKHRKSEENKRIFFAVIMLRSIGAIPFGPTVSLSDSVAYDILGPRNRALWGQQRMFGTLAWGIIAGILGPLVDEVGNYDPVFYSFGAFGIGATLIALFWLPKRMPIHQSDQDSIISPMSKTPKRLPFGAALRSVLRIPIFCISCIVALTSGMFLGVLYVVWPILIIKDLHAPKSLIGIAAIISCSVEVPSFFFAGALVNRIGEPVCFLLMYAAYTVRFVCYAYLTPATVWLALVLEVLHIFCFAFYFTAATRLAATIAPPGTSATVQAILQASYFGLGLGLGNYASSRIYEIFHGYWAFLIYAAFSSFLFVVLFILYIVYLRKEIARVKSHKPERMGSFSPTLMPDASFMDDDNDNVNQLKLDTSTSTNNSNDSRRKPLPTEPLITSAPHFSEL